MTHEVAPGIHQIPLDTPFAVGTVNTYLIEDERLTLVDCGPNTATALDDFESRLAEVGHGIADIELIVVTHQHLDHVGLAGTLHARTGAELVALDSLAPIMADWPGFSLASDDDAYTLMLRHGVEPHVAEALRAVAGITRGYGASAQVDRTLAPGDTLSLGARQYEVFHRPGHSITDTVFYDRANKLALLGDHLIARVSSNALVTGRDGPDSRRSESLLQYRASMRATREMEIDLGLPGHGLPVPDHRELIDGRLVEEDRRAEHFYELLAAGPRSAHEIAIARWGRVAVTQAFLTLSEVLGHLGLLLADGRVVEDGSGDVITFAHAD